MEGRMTERIPEFYGTCPGGDHDTQCVLCECCTHHEPDCAVSKTEERMQLMANAIDDMDQELRNYRVQNFGTPSVLVASLFALVVAGFSLCLGLLIGNGLDSRSALLCGIAAGAYWVVSVMVLVRLRRAFRPIHAASSRASYRRAP